MSLIGRESVAGKIFIAGRVITGSAHFALEESLLYGGDGSDARIFWWA